MTIYISNQVQLPKTKKVMLLLCCVKVFPVLYQGNRKRFGNCGYYRQVGTNERHSHEVPFSMQAVLQKQPTVGGSPNYVRNGGLR